jgi:hypothetical protein
MSKKRIVAGIELHPDRPTTLTYHQLFQWVIWQFPIRRQKGFCGAVRPPEAEQEWIPAIIQSDNKRVQVYAHVGETFPTPETAVEYFSTSKGSK